MAFCTHFRWSNWDKKNWDKWGSLLTLEFTLKKSKLHGVFRLETPFNLTYWSIKSDDLHVDLQFYHLQKSCLKHEVKVVWFGWSIRQYVSIVQENKNIQSLFAQKVTGQVWRPFWMSISGGHFENYFWFCSLNYLGISRMLCAKYFNFTTKPTIFPKTCRTTIVYSR